MNNIKTQLNTLLNLIIHKKNPEIDIRAYYIKNTYHLNIYFYNTPNTNLVSEYKLYQIFKDLLYKLGSMSMSVTVKDDSISDGVKLILSEYFISYLPESELPLLNEFILTR